jgi:hypothetical protein
MPLKTAVSTAFKPLLDRQAAASITTNNSQTYKLRIYMPLHVPESRRMQLRLLPWLTWQHNDAASASCPAGMMVEVGS